MRSSVADQHIVVYNSEGIMAVDTFNIPCI